MAPNPDFRQYVDLTLFDKDVQDIFSEAVTNMAIDLPEWVPREGNIETLLLEAFALEVSEGLFAINRLPNSIMQILLQQFGVFRDIGIQPVVNLTFNVVGTSGFTIPAGTSVMLSLADGIPPVVFSTDVDLVLQPGTTSGSVTATGDRYTTDANNIVGPINVPLLDTLTFVNFVTLDSMVSNGRDQEDDTAWIARGTERFVQLSQALVLPVQFQAAALEDASVIRAKGIDNWDGSGTPGGQPGHITVAVYGEGVPLSATIKNTLRTTLLNKAVANLAVNVIDASIQAIDITAVVVPDAGYDPAQCIINVKDAINAYLGYKNWDWSTTVHRNALIQVIGSAEGVAYVSTLSAPASDVTLSAQASLAVPGTLTITTA